ncbi:hypothetical protein K227x_45240 [Rubripirellula lacrimiformis]|uniref:Uncharacterized protein n=1 Tax=Rubripirellula lacrimiformis TaxID=1930273 RepID=A0A517NG55_9BACT|nr:hypothetical protein K227x_45240 [Rubripirellula lacrimiformis]
MARTVNPNTKSFNRVGNAPRVHSLKRTPPWARGKQQWTRRMARTVNPNTKSFNRVANAPRVHSLKRTPPWARGETTVDEADIADSQPQREIV